MAGLDLRMGLRTLKRTGALALALGFAACATAPLELDRAQKAYGTAAEDPEVASHAEVELYLASKTLKNAAGAWDEEGDSEESRHLAYLAERQIEIARVAARRKRAEAQLARLAREREGIVLEARTEEADSFRSRAEAQAREVAQLQRELKELGAKKSERGIVLTLGDVLFDLDSADLRAGTLRRVYGLLTFLRENPDRSIIIEGHTDSTGDAAYNAELSRRRAHAVRTFLLDNGVAGDRIVAAGYGEDFPVTSNASSAGRQQNRRVEVVILDPGASPAEQLRLPAVAAPR